MTRRILVTGSRTWSDVHIVEGALMEHADDADTLVHGACPEGADAWADSYWSNFRSGEIERWPAHWDQLGKAAGFIRNHNMARTKPDLCLAFIRDNSPGATHCLEQVKREGLPAIVYRRDYLTGSTGS